MKVYLLPPDCSPEEVAACQRGEDTGHRRITPTKAAKLERLGKALPLDDSRTIFFETTLVALKIPEQRGAVPRAQMIDEDIMLAALPVHLGGKAGPAGDAARLKIKSFDGESIAIAGVVFDLHDLYFFGTELVQAQPREDIHFDDYSIWCMTKPLIVSVRLLHPEITARVREYMKLRWEPRGHMPLETFGRFVKGGWQEQLVAANELLDKLWPEIALQFVAGAFTERLTGARGSELPPVLVHRVLRTYLREWKSELERRTGFDF